MAEIFSTTAPKVETGQTRLLEKEAEVTATAAIRPASGGTGTAPTEQSWEELSKELEIYGLDRNFRLRFSVDEATGRTVIQIINPETEKVVREIPPEETLRIAAHLQKMLHQIVDTKV